MRQQNHTSERSMSKLDNRLAAELPDFEGMKVVFGLEEPLQDESMDEDSFTFTLSEFFQADEQSPLTAKLVA